MRPVPLMGGPAAGVCLLAGLLALQPAVVRADDYTCLRDDDCQAGYCAFIRGETTGLCIPVNDALAHSRTAPPQAGTPDSEADTVSASCLFSVDCMSGYACYSRMPVTAPGICKPRIEQP